MSTFSNVRQARADLLTAAGLTDVTLDPAANVPMVLVDAITVRAAAGVGGWTGELPVRIVVPGPGNADALAMLEDRLEVVLATLGGAPAVPETYGPTELPAYTVTYPVDIPNPNC